MNRPIQRPPGQPHGHSGAPTPYVFDERGILRDRRTGAAVETRPLIARPPQPPPRPRGDVIAELAAAMAAAVLVVLGFMVIAAVGALALAILVGLGVLR